MSRLPRSRLRVIELWPYTGNYEAQATPVNCGNDQRGQAAIIA